MKTIEPVGEREVLHILQIVGMTGGGAGAKTEIGGAGAMTEVEGAAKEIGMGPRDIVLEVQGGAMVEKTWTDGEEMITMGESALTVQIDLETLEIEGETDVTTMTSTRIVLRKESGVIHAHHPLLLDQDNFEARLHILNALKHPYLLMKTPSEMVVLRKEGEAIHAHHPLLVDQDNLEARLHILNAPKHPYLLKKKPSEIMTPLYPCGKNSTPALEPFATKVFVIEISKNPPKKSLSTFLITVIPR